MRVPVPVGIRVFACALVCPVCVPAPPGVFLPVGNPTHSRDAARNPRAADARDRRKPPAGRSRRAKIMSKMMMSGLKTMAAGAKAGADLSARTAQATKLRADIVLLQRSVASAKKDFGPHVYDAMVSGNQSEIDRLFADVKAKVQGLEAQIEAKRQAVADLKVPASARGSGGDDDVTPPPPGPAPEAADVPAGWKKTTTAEGREYYYHEATGETSWTVPTAKE